jgi:hypothetical protein
MTAKAIPPNFAAYDTAKTEAMKDGNFPRSANNVHFMH